MSHPPIDAQHWGQRLTTLAERFKVPGAQLGILRIGAQGGADDKVVASHDVISLRDRARIGSGYAVQPRRRYGSTRRTARVLPRSGSSNARRSRRDLPPGSPSAGPVIRLSSRVSPLEERA